MESPLPNLLLRKTSETPDSPVSHGAGEASHDHDHDHFSVSFRSKPAAVGGGGGGGSPLSTSPPALQLTVKERWDVSPRSVVTSLKDWPPSNEGQGKAGGGGSRGEVDMLEWTRLLSLGIWDDGTGVQDLGNAAAAAAVAADVIVAADVSPGDQGVSEEEASGVAKGGSLQPQE